MIAAAGAGPEPIPYRELTSAKLTEAIQFCLQVDAQTAAKSISASMNREAGVRAAVNSFYANLPISEMFCDLMPGQPAVWQYRRKDTHFKLSGVAAEVLTSHHKVDGHKLKL